MTRWIVIAALSLLGSAHAQTPDRPETGLQGQTSDAEAKVGIYPVPFSKGVNIIGHNDIAQRGGNLIMAWSRHCAYVAGGAKLTANGPVIGAESGPTSGVAVIDVRRPEKPNVVRYLQDKGALAAGETMHAVTTKVRAVLAASTYGGVAGTNGPKEGWLNIYDIRDCAKPKLMAEVKWPEPAHTITVSPDGKRVYGTIISPFTQDGAIQVMDISDMAKPRFVGKFLATLPNGTSAGFAVHEVRLSPDERRIYAGVLSSKDTALNKHITTKFPSAEAFGGEAGGIYIFDNEDLASGKSDPKLRLIGQMPRAGWHSPALARINGVPHVVNAGELGACPGAWPKITNIADERNPRIVGEFRLAMNHIENCPKREGIEVATGGLLGRVGTATTHFNDVDSETNTKLGLFSFMYAGLRIADLRDPANPAEIAYFKPGDPCASHVRYLPKTGQIWFACNDSGFWVIALKPEIEKGILGKKR